MEPDRQEIDHVVARVVAWHNRHPLALTITAAHVHSVGVVNLPFAVKGARVERVEPAPTAEPALPVAPPPPAAEPEPAAEAGEPVVELVTELEAPAAAAPLQAVTAPPVSDDAVPSAPSAPAALPAPSCVPAIAAEEALASAAQTIVHLPKRPPRRGWARWWAALHEPGVFQSLFSEDFAPPLRPRRIARWAAWHGVAELPLGRAAQQRFVTLDAGLRRAGQGPEVQIYLLTAAIGIGEQRKRVLLAPDPQGPVIGPRHWNRPRQAALAAGASCLMAVMASTVIGLWPSAPTAAAAAAAGSPARAASVALAAASNPAEPARAASAPASQPAVQQANVASAPPPIQPYPMPPDVEPRLGRIELPSIKPKLSDGDRQASREPAGGTKDKPVGPAVARQWITLPPAPAKAYALVSRPMADLRKSERVVAQLQAVALLQPKPMRTELMKTAKGWLAVSWPFASAGDAEKVRLALADKGLRTEVIEF